MNNQGRRSAVLILALAGFASRLYHRPSHQFAGRGEPGFPVQGPLPHHEAGAATVPGHPRRGPDVVHGRIPGRSASPKSSPEKKLQGRILRPHRRGQPPVFRGLRARLAPGPRPGLHPARSADESDHVPPGSHVLGRSDRVLVLRIFPAHVHRRLVERQLQTRSGKRRGKSRSSTGPRRIGSPTLVPRKAGSSSRSRSSGRSRARP